MKRSRYDENEIKLFSTHAEISLYNMKGDVVNKAIVDLGDVERVRVHTWTLKVSTGKLKYAINSKVGRLHHFVMKSKERLDHIDTNGLNNRKGNLRPALQIQNAKNMSKGVRNTSGAKGSSWNKGMCLYEAYIFVDNKSLNLGYFDNVIDAAEAYNEAAVKYYKEFANLNDIELLKESIANGTVIDRTEEITKRKLLLESRKQVKQSGVTGVSWHGKSLKWLARIEYNKKIYHLGTYDDLAEAISARKEAEVKVANNIIPEMSK